MKYPTVDDLTGFVAVLPVVACNIREHGTDRWRSEAQDICDISKGGSCGA